MSNLFYRVRPLAIILMYSRLLTCLYKRFNLNCSSNRWHRQADGIRHAHVHGIRQDTRFTWYWTIPLRSNDMTCRVVFFLLTKSLSMWHCKWSIRLYAWHYWLPRISLLFWEALMYVSNLSLTVAHLLLVIHNSLELLTSLAIHSHIRSVTYFLLDRFRIMNPMLRCVSLALYIVPLAIFGLVVLCRPHYLIFHLIKERFMRCEIVTPQRDKHLSKTEKGKKTHFVLGSLTFITYMRIGNHLKHPAHLRFPYTSLYFFWFTS